MTPPAHGPLAHDLERMHAEFHSTRDPRLRDRLVVAHLPFAMSVVRPYLRRREVDDVVQAAYIGLINAVERFDPGRGIDFRVFARATITGEVKRHYRDRAWSVRVPRSLHDHYLAVAAALDELNVELGRSPTMQEIARRVGLTPEEVVEAMEASSAYEAGSLDASASDGDGSGNHHPRASGGYEAVDNHLSLVPLLARLGPVERQILHLRFVEERSQSEIGAIVGVSQMQVSRVLRDVLARLRTQLDGD